RPVSVPGMSREGRPTGHLTVPGAGPGRPVGHLGTVPGAGPGRAGRDLGGRAAGAPPAPGAPGAAGGGRPGGGVGARRGSWRAPPGRLMGAGEAGADAGRLSRWLPRPQELLLAELGRASRVYPELADGLRQPRPCALDLDADGAYRFLSTAAPALDEAGFGVLLPSWWTRRRRLGLTGSAHTQADGVVGKPGMFGTDQLVDFRWRLAVGDDTLTEEEIEALAQTKAPLVRVRGQWVAVDPDQLRRGLEFLARNQAGQATAGEILRLAAAHPEDSGIPLPATRSDAHRRAR